MVTRSLYLLRCAFYRSSVRRELVTKELRWIDITDPSRDDLRFLREQMGFHPLDVAECQTTTYLPKVEPHPTYLFLVVHVPIYLPKERASAPMEFDIFVSPEAIVTVHAGSAKALESLFRDVSKQADLRERMLGRGTPYVLYSILDRLFEAAFPMLNQIAGKLARAERRIFAGEERSMVSELSAIQRDLTAFRSIVRPQRHLYETGFLQGDWGTPALQIVFRGLHGKFTRLWEYLETLWERADALAATNNALLSHKLNEFVKVLTTLSAVFIPFGLIAQVVLFIDEGVGLSKLFLFWFIILLMLAVDAVILWSARHRKIL